MAAGGFGSDSPDRALIAATARHRFEVLLGAPIAPESVLVIGDTVHDVDCGRVNGFKTLAVGTGGVSLESMAAAGADRVLEDLADTEGVLGHLSTLLSI